MHSNVCVEYRHNNNSVICHIIIVPRRIGINNQEYQYYIKYASSSKHECLSNLLGSDACYNN